MLKVFVLCCYCYDPERLRKFPQEMKNVQKMLLINNYMNSYFYGKKEVWGIILFIDIFKVQDCYKR